MSITLKDWAASYVRNCQPADNGSRNNTAFNIAGHLHAAESESGERLSERDIIDVLTDWNHRLADPLPDDEIRGTVKSAVQENGTPRETKIINSFRYAKPKPIMSDEQTDVPDVDIVSFSALCKAHPKLNPVVIDGLLRQGETCNIIAPSKVGKSWLAYDIALSINAERMLLDAFACTAGRVLLVDNELHPSVIAHRPPKVAEARGIESSEYADRLDVLPLRGQGVSLPMLARYVERIESGYYQVVIADAWYRFIPEGCNENSNADVMALSNTLDRYAASTGAAWIVVHHASKGDQSGKAVTDVGSGAGAQSRAADTHLVLRPHEDDGHFVLEAAVRSFPPVEPIGLQWDFPVWNRAYALDTSRLKGKKSASEERQAKNDAEGHELILKALATKAMTINQIRREAGLSRDRAERLIGQLLSAGKVVAQPITIRGNPTHEYRLPTT
jgi:hypothetical protein